MFHLNLHINCTHQPSHPARKTFCHFSSNISVHKKFLVFLIKSVWRLQVAGLIAGPNFFWGRWEGVEKNPITPFLHDRFALNIIFKNVEYPKYPRGASNPQSDQETDMLSIGTSGHIRNEGKVKYYYFKIEIFLFLLQVI